MTKFYNRKKKLNFIFLYFKNKEIHDLHFSYGKHKIKKFVVNIRHWETRRELKQ